MLHFCTVAHASAGTALFPCLSCVYMISYTSMHPYTYKCVCVPSGTWVDVSTVDAVVFPTVRYIDVEAFHRASSPHTCAESLCLLLCACSPSDTSCLKSGNPAASSSRFFRFDYSLPSRSGNCRTCSPAGFLATMR